MAFLSGYTRRKAITIDHARVDSDLSGFPLPVTLTSDADVGADIDSDGFNIRFTTSDGTTTCSYDRRTFSLGGGQASGKWYVRVPTVAGASNTTLYIYFKPDSPVDGNDADAVWSGFTAVYHDPSDPVDATSNNNDGTDTNVSQADGVFHKAGDFNGTDSRVDCGSATTVDQIFRDGTGGTGSAWIRLDDFGEGGFGRIFQKAVGGTAEVGLSVGATANAEALQFFCAYATATGVWHTTADLSTGTWLHVAASYNGTNAANDPTLYINGEPQTITESTAPSGTLGADSSANLILGNRNNASNFDRTFNGLLEEIRFTKSSQRSAAWIKFEYYSIAESVYTLGALETRGGLLLRLQEDGLFVGGGGCL